MSGGVLATVTKESIMLGEKKLYNKRVSILATHGVEESELLQPREALENAGAEVDLVSLDGGHIRLWRENSWSSPYKADRSIDSTKPMEYDALYLPGGVINADKLRVEKSAVDFTRYFTQNGKPIAAICHGPWVLIETGVVQGRKMTSWPSLKSDLENAGAVWVNEPVVADNGLVTSRKPEDIPKFNEKMIEEFCEGEHSLSA
jgi:protease I